MPPSRRPETGGFFAGPVHYAGHLLSRDLGNFIITDNYAPLDQILRGASLVDVDAQFFGSLLYGSKHF